MKNIVFIVVLFFLVHSLYGRNTYHADSIRVIGQQYHVGSGFDRMQIFEYINRLKKDTPDVLFLDSISKRVNQLWYAYVDTTVTKDNDVKEILYRLRNLEKVKKLKYGTSFCLLEATYFNELDEISWFSTGNISYYLFMMVFANNNIDYIWIGREHLERGRYILRLSDDYKRLLSKYTHVYDADFRKKVEPK